MNHEELIGRLAPVTDEEAARMVTAGTRADLAERIMSTAVPEGRPARRRRKLAFGLPLAAAAAGAAVALVAVSTGSGTSRTPTAPRPSAHGPVKVRLAALSFSTRGRYLVVKVKDPVADPARYRQEFAAHGMNIDLRLVPASPSVVGTVVMSEGGEVKTITAPGRCSPGGGGACPVGVKIPLGFKAHASVVFGRAAKPGEQYVSTVSAFAPGEALHCVDVRGRTIDQALPLLRRAKVTVAQWRYDGPQRADGGTEVRATSDRGKIPGTWYVEDADPWAPGQVLLFVGPAKSANSEADGYFARVMRGCPR
jgi:hypothetical protein